MIYEITRESQFDSLVFVFIMKAVMIYREGKTSMPCPSSRMI